MTRSNGEIAWEAEALRVLADVKLAAHSATNEEIEADLREALDCAKRQGAKGFELRAAISLAGLLASQDKRREGYDLLGPLYEEFTEGLGTPTLKQARALLDKLG